MPRSGSRARDTGASWAVAPAHKPGRVKLADDPGEVVALWGPADRVLLALWKRLTMDEARLEIEGSEETLRRFVARPITP